MRAFGGAVGYRPRVQSAYYMRVYRHIWQAREKDEHAMTKITEILRFSPELLHLPCLGNKESCIRRFAPST